MMHMLCVFAVAEKCIFTFLLVRQRCCVYRNAAVKGQVAALMLFMLNIERVAAHCCAYEFRTKKSVTLENVCLICQTVTAEALY